MTSPMSTEEFHSDSNSNSSASSPSQLPLLNPFMQTALYQQYMNALNVFKMQQMQTQDPLIMYQQFLVRMAASQQHIVPKQCSMASKDLGSAKKRSNSRGSSNSTDTVVGPKRLRQAKKALFDDVKSSPVSGMYIKEETAAPVTKIDTDSKQAEVEDLGANFVQITEEARRELSKIDNVIGDYNCRLCHVTYSDAFRLAAHCCPRIGHVEYRCEECDKVFNCPANLASHQRWHKPWKDNRSKIDAINAVAHMEEIPLNLTIDASQSNRCLRCSKLFGTVQCRARHNLTHGVDCADAKDFCDCGRC